MRHLDYPDVASLAIPSALLVINGTKDGLFDLDGVRGCFTKLSACYAKAGVAERIPRPAVRHAARVQLRDAAGGVGVAHEVGVMHDSASGVPRAGVHWAAPFVRQPRMDSGPAPRTLLRTMADGWPRVAALNSSDQGR